MPNSKWLIPDLTTSQDLTSGALSYTTSIGRQFKLNEITFHASVAITETITITLNSAKGANYDTVLRKITLTSGQDYVYRPQGEPTFQAGDEITIAVTNANTTGIMYVKIKAEELLK